jgi:hypothetical protein
MMRHDNAGLRRSRQASRLLWELDKDVIWHEPEPRSNGRYRAYFEATEEQAKAITAAGNDYLNSGEGFLSRFDQGETKMLLTWRPRAHPKKAIPGAKRDRPRSELMRQLMADPVLGRRSRSTLYRWVAALERERDAARSIPEAGS